MRLMGIDPGIATTGWGVVESDGKNYVCCGVGTITTPAKTDPGQRLATIYDDMVELLETFIPDVVVIEELFFNTNVTTAISVGQARGVVLLAAAKKGISVCSYTPLQVKMAITGYGRAEKQQVQGMVQQLLKLEKIPKPDDAADALAIALTHAFSFKLKRLEKKK